MSSTLEKIWQETEDNYIEAQGQDKLIQFSRSVEQRLSAPLCVRIVVASVKNDNKT